MIPYRLARELAHQLEHAGEHERLAQVLARPEVYMALSQGESEYDVMRWWARLRKQGHDPGVLLAEALDGYHPSSPEAECRACSVAARLLKHLGVLAPAVEIQRRVIELASGQGLRLQHADAENLLGTMFLDVGDLGPALEHFERARSMYHDIGDTRGAAMTVGNTGIVHARRGDYQQARECLEYDLNVARQLGDLIGQAKSIGNLGTLYAQQGDFQRALECYQEHLEVARMLGNHASVHMALGNIGLLYRNHGRYREALELQQQLLEDATELGDRRTIAHVLANMAATLESLGHYERALEMAQQALEHERDMGDRRSVAFSLANIGILYRLQGHYEHAFEFHFQAEAELRDIGFDYALAYCLAGRATLLCELAAQADPAPGYLQRFVADATGDRWRTVVLERARADATECLQISRRINNADTEFLSRLLLARIDDAEGNTPAGIAALEAMLDECSDESLQAQLHYWLFRLGGEQRQNHRQRALELLTALNSEVPTRERQRIIYELSAEAEP